MKLIGTKMKKLDDDVTLIKTKGYVYYLKWVATFVILFAVACRSVEEIPKIYDIVLSWIGTGMWLIVSIAWKDRALILLNSVISFMLFVAILRWIF
jgi:hypothetical protein